MTLRSAIWVVPAVCLAAVSAIHDGSHRPTVCSSGGLDASAMSLANDTIAIASSGLSAADRAAIVEGVQAHAGPRYAVARWGDSLRAENTARRISTVFSPDGVEVTELASLRTARVGLDGVRCGDTRQAVLPARPIERENRVEMPRTLRSVRGESKVVEWYTNGPLGLEQGFDIDRSPCAPGERIAIEMALGNDVRPVLRGDAVELRGADGSRAIRYGDLRVIDARQHEVEARMVVEGQKLALEIDTSKAVFPIVVDPLIGADFNDLDGDAEGDHFGTAIDTDGTTVVIGVPHDDDAGLDAGSVYVFQKTSGWSILSRLMPNTLTPGSRFGEVVSLSGNTVAVTADLNVSPNTGTVYVYTFNGPNWQQEAVLQGDPQQANGGFGRALDLNVDTLAVGIPYDSTTALNLGSVRVFARSGGVWSEEFGVGFGNELSDVFFGTSVAVSGDTLLVGAPGDGTVAESSGSAHFFTRTSGAWSFLSSVGADNTPTFASFGQDVAIEGTRAVIGAPGDASDGAGYVFEFEGAAWTRKAMIAPDGGPNNTDIGQKVGLSGGTLALMGNDSDGGSSTVYLYTGAGATWTAGPEFLYPESYASAPARTFALGGSFLVLGSVNQASNGGSAGQVNVLRDNGSSWVTDLSAVPYGGTLGDDMGRVVALSGNTAVVGAPAERGAGDSAGRVYVHVRQNGAWSRETTITSSSPQPLGLYGTSVAIEGDTLVVGAPGEGQGTGSVSVYERSQGVWSQVASLAGSDIGSGVNFGAAVTIQGSTIVVGAPKVFPGGAAYVFEKSGGVWGSIESAKVTTNDPNVARFGTSLSLDGSTLLIGAPLDGELGSIAGAGYVFVKGGGIWTQQTKLNDANATANDYAGNSVSIVGDQAMVGATTSSGNGFVTVFDRVGNSWSQSQHLTAANCGFFGSSISVSGAHSIIACQDGYEIWTKNGTWQRDSFNSPIPSTAYVALDGDTFVYGQPGGAGVKGRAIAAVIRNAQGDSCSLATDCASGFCQDGFCCDTACNGACETCGGAVPGTCAPVVSAPDPDSCFGTHVCDVNASCKSSNGVMCTGGAAQCASGFCVDNVCCDVACGGNDTTDCQACSVAAGATQNGVCNVLPTSHVCGVFVNDGCDIQDHCSGDPNNVTCTDTKQPDTTPCPGGVCTSGSCVATGGTGGTAGTAGTGGTGGTAGTGGTGGSAGAGGSGATGGAGGTAGTGGAGGTSGSSGSGPGLPDLWGVGDSTGGSAGSAGASGASGSSGTAGSSAAGGGYTRPPEADISPIQTPNGSSNCSVSIENSGGSNVTWVSLLAALGLAAGRRRARSRAS